MTLTFPCVKANTVVSTDMLPIQKDIEGLKELLKDKEKNYESIKKAKEELTEKFQKVSEELYKKVAEDQAKQQQAAGAAQEGAEKKGKEKKEEKVVDAEYEVKDDKKKK